jgi:hypothetical protein
VIYATGLSLTCGHTNIIIFSFRASERWKRSYRGSGLPSESLALFRSAVGVIYTIGPNIKSSVADGTASLHVTPLR